VELTKKYWGIYQALRNFLLKLVETKEIVKVIPVFWEKRLAWIVNGASTTISANVRLFMLELNFKNLASVDPENLGNEVSMIDLVL
jgi:hypothetical protein